MKISREKVARLLILLLIFSDVCFFSFPALSNQFISICTYFEKKLCAVIVIILAISVIYFYNGKIKVGAGQNEHIINLYFVLIISTMTVSFVAYKMNVRLFLAQYYYYFIPPILILILKFLMEKYESFYLWIIDAVIVVGILYALYTLVAYFLFESSGKVIMDTNIQLYSARNGHLRIPRVADFISFSTVLSIIKCFDKQQRRVRYFFGSVVGITALFIVTQTRIYQICILVTLIVLLLNAQKNVFNKLFVLILIGGCAFLLSDSIRTFIESFTEISFSTENRVFAYIYYLGHFFDNVFWGLGFVPSSTHYSLLHGHLGLYFLSDCGYIGFISVFGIAGILFLIACFYYLFHVMAFSFSHFTKSDDFVMCGLTIYLVISN